MRTVDRPVGVSIDHGRIRLECAGAAETLTPLVAERVGRHLLDAFPDGCGADIRARIGRLLLDSAAGLKSAPAAVPVVADGALPAAA